MFDELYFEISGVCNANCLYCVNGKKSISGTQHKKTGKILAPEQFEKTITHLLNQKIISSDTKISLFVWGEPLLNKNITKIFKHLNEKNLKYRISTNGSVNFPFSAMDISGLDYIIFSMPGFSQRAYDKIHGFNFDTITYNIKSMASSLDNLGYTGRKIIFYHVYKFNTNEFTDAQNFAMSINATINPHLAFLNGYNMSKSFVKNKSNILATTNISSDVFTEHYNNIIDARPENFTCPQYSRLTIDENCDILMCCGMDRAENRLEGNIGNVFSFSSIADIQNKRIGSDICRECSNLGLDYLFDKPVYLNDLDRLNLTKHINC